MKNLNNLTARELLGLPQIKASLNRSFDVLKNIFNINKRTAIKINEKNQCYTDGKNIVIGSNFPLFAPFEGSYLYEAVNGAIYHELGHIIYTPLSAELKAQKCLKNGYFHPFTASATQVLADMKDYRDTDPRCIAACTSVYHYLFNIIEDGRIESILLCDARFKRYRIGLQRLRIQMYEDNQTLDELIEDKKMPLSDYNPKDRLNIMYNLLLQYVRFGEIKGYTNEFEKNEIIIDFFNLLDTVDRFIASKNTYQILRFMNQLFILLWDKYIKPYIDYKMDNEDFSEDCSTFSESDGLREASVEEDLLEIDGLTKLPILSEEEAEKLESMAKEERRRIAAESMKEGAKDTEKESGSVDACEGGEGSEETSKADTEDSEREASSTFKLPSLGELSDGKGLSIEKTKDEVYSASPVDLEKLLACEEKSDTVSESDFEKIKTTLEDLDGIDLGIHSSLSWNIVTPSIPSNYQEYDKFALMNKRIHIQAKKVERELNFAPKSQIKRGFLGGTKFNATSVAKADLKHFSKRVFEPGNPTLSVAILVDESGSMSGYNIEMARAAAIQLYEFCNYINIPIAVFGHTADVGCNVTINAYCYFGENNKDTKYKLLGIRARSNNRDGAAIKFVAEHLLKQPSEKKLLFVISDGLPSANGYNGASAFKDVANTVKLYEKKGIRTIAAAIDQNKKQIEEMYGAANFLDITELESLPSNLVRIIKRQLF